MCEESLSMTPPLSPTSRVVARKEDSQEFLWEEFGVSPACVPLHVDPTCFDCKGEVSRHNPELHPAGYVFSGELEDILFPSAQYVPFPWTGKNVVLFGANFDAGSALLVQTDLLFCLARKEVMSLIAVTCSSHMPTTPVDARKMRMDVAEFLTYIRKFLNSNAVANMDMSKSALRNAMYSLCVLMGSVEDIPGHTLSHIPSAVGNKSSSAWYHLLHLRLDIQLTYLATLHALDRFNHTPDQESQSQDPFSCAHPNNPRKEFVESVQQCMSQLIYLTAIRYNGAGGPINVARRINIVKSSPFACTCVREFWVALRLMLDDQASTGQDFWSVLQHILSRSSSVGNSKCASISTPAIPVVANPTEFDWWLIHHLAWNYVFDCRGRWNVQRANFHPNYPMLNQLLRRLLNEDMSEAEACTYVKSMSSLSEIWSSNLDAILILWDYFCPRLNSAFADRQDSVRSFATVQASGSSWLKLVRDYLGGTEQSSSFGVFVGFLGWQVKGLAPREWRQVKGRILANFHPGRVQSLTQYGVHNLATLLLALADSADLQDLSSKFLDLLSYVPKSSGYEELVWKAHVATILLHSEKGQDLGSVGSRLASLLDRAVTEFASGATSFERRRELGSLVGVYMEMLKDLATEGSNLNLSESTLIVPAIGKYLTGCKSGELTFALDCLLAVVRRLAEVAGDGGTGPSDHQHQTMISCCLSHLLPSVKSLCTTYSSVTTSAHSQLAQMAHLLCLLTLLHSGQEKGPSLCDLFRHFAVGENVPAEVSLPFLAHCLSRQSCHPDSSGMLLATLSLQDPSYQSTVVQSWMQCMLLIPDLQTGHVRRVLEAVGNLPDVMQICGGKGFNCGNEEESLLQFVKNVGCAYEQCSDFSTKMALKQSFLQYVSCANKCLAVVTKNWGPQELVQRMFSFFGCLLEHCGPLIYVKTKSDCLLATMMSQLVLPHVVYKAAKEPLHPSILDAAASVLSQIVSGLAKLHYQKDAYISRQLKDTVIQYLPLFPSNREHPLLACFANSDSQLKQFLLEAVKVHYFTNHSRTSPAAPTVRVMRFLLEALLAMDSLEAKEEVGKVLFACLLEYLMLTENAAFKSEATKILEFTLRSLLRLELRQIIVDKVSTFTRTHLAFNTLKAFRVLQGLAMLNQELMAEVFPTVKETVSSVEKRRGVASDRTLREGLEKLQVMLKISG